jgi:hypothetical protein
MLFPPMPGGRIGVSHQRRSENADNAEMPVFVPYSGRPASMLVPFSSRTNALKK